MELTDLITFYFRHPDKSNHPEAETKFIEITTAYEVNNFYQTFIQYYCFVHTYVSVC